jgi:cytoskeletal protein CcmA (bactofilin family)
MPPAKAAREIEPNFPATNGGLSAFPNRPFSSAKAQQPLHAVTASAPKQNPFHFPGRTPVIIGEITYRGWLPVDGILSGQLNGNGGALSVKQRTRNGNSESQPELNGDIYFKDMVRINGHIAGKVSSERGILIVAESAVVDASIEVGTAVINGKVNGDIVGRQRVELGPCAVINGDISSPALAIKPGAIFHGRCRMKRMVPVACT